MTKKSILQTIVLLSPIAFIFAFTPFFPENYGLCKKALDYDCYDRYEDQYGNTGIVVIFLSSILLLVSSLWLAKLRYELIFNTWIRFAKWYLLVSSILILIAGISSGGGNWGLGSGYGDVLGGIFLLALFLLISIAIIVVKSWKLRKKEARM